jgi:hypothetical protein
MVDAARKLSRLAAAALLIGAVLSPAAVFAANYGSDVYGGGDFGQGVDLTGGTMIYGSGPLAPGYVNTTAVVTVSTSSAVAIGSPLTLATTTGATSSAGLLPTLPPTGDATILFAHSLQYRDVSPDVRRLQQYLNAHGFALATDGPGAPGQETDLFGPLTLHSLIKFQEAHTAAILTPVGLATGTGYFGPLTRAFINQAN